MYNARTVSRGAESEDNDTLSQVLSPKTKLSKTPFPRYFVMPLHGVNRTRLLPAVRSLKGDAENARHEIAGHENAAPCCRGGKCET